MALPALIGLASQFASGAGNPITAPEAPINTTASSTFQGGSLVVGAKQVGGKGNEAGATSASAAQTPSAEVARAAMISSTDLPPWLPWVVVGVAVLFFSLLLPRRRK